VSIVCSELSFSWPDGTPVLSGLNAAFGPGRTGLIGSNGSGKSTLLRLIVGELAPVSGAVTVTGDVGYLPQDLTLDTAQTVASILGIAAARDAIAAIENGDVSEAAFAAVGDDWDVEDRARGWLSMLGLDHLGLDDQVATLSGGETMMTALAALFLRRPAVICLDEPTNNLDRDARERLYAAVAGEQGLSSQGFAAQGFAAQGFAAQPAMVIVSHDRELLGLVDQIAELSDGTLRMYGGNLAAYEEQRAAEQAAAERAVTAAAADLRRQRRDLVASQTRQARRDRQGRRAAASGGLPKIVADERRRSAQETAGRSREVHLERIEAAAARLAGAEEAVREDAEIRIELPGTAVPAGRTVLTVTGLDGPWHPGAKSGARDDDGEQAPALDELIVRGRPRAVCPAASGSARCSRRCCSRSLPRTSWSSTSPRTTWTWPRCANCPRRCPATGAR
jgi:ATPase subunit of ABC transporter with duplicated ATPase domains